MIITAEDLDYSSSVPLYQQLFDVLIDRCDHSDLSPGDPLPTEESLTRELRVSRATVNRAYRMLLEENCVDRIPGVGTFVRPRRMRRDLAQASDFLEETKRLGRTPSYRLVKLTAGRPTRIQRDRLQLAPDEQVWHLDRLQLVDERPVAIEHLSIPVALLPNLTKAQAQEPVFSLLRQAAGTEATLHQALGAGLLPEADATLLGVKTGAAMFRFERDTIGDDGRPWEYGIVHTPAVTTRYDCSVHTGAASVSF